MRVKLYLTALLVFMFIIYKTYRINSNLTEESLGVSYTPTVFLNNESITVVQYNVQMNPAVFIHEGNEIRSALIPERITSLNSGDIDVITLCEVFDDVARKLIWKKFSELGWKYHTTVIDSHSYMSNGGITIVSKWPILYTEQHIFNNTIGSDSLAAKGCMYAKIQKNNLIFNVFSTHLQAWSIQKNRETRLHQILEMYNFYKSKNIPENEPVIFSGDFNTDYINSYHEVEALFRTLNSVMPTRHGKQLYTSDPETNSLVGQDGSDKVHGCQQDYYCSICYSSGTDNLGWCANDTNVNKCIGTTKTLPRCKCCPKEYLDYILYSKAHKQPINLPVVEVIPLKAESSFVFHNWRIGDAGYPKFYTDDLSDHYPIITKLIF